MEGVRGSSPLSSTRSPGRGRVEGGGPQSVVLWRKTPSSDLPSGLLSRPPGSNSGSSPRTTAVRLRSSASWQFGDPASDAADDRLRADSPLSEHLEALLLPVRGVLGHDPSSAAVYDLEQAIQEKVTEELLTEVLGGALTVTDLLDDRFVRDLHAPRLRRTSRSARTGRFRSPSAVRRVVACRHSAIRNGSCWRCPPAWLLGCRRWLTCRPLPRIAGADAAGHAPISGHLDRFPSWNA